jgi:hypothetical protein
MEDSHWEPTSNKLIDTSIAQEKAPTYYLSGAKNIKITGTRKPLNTPQQVQALQ